MKTKNLNKLDFNKGTIVELNDKQILSVNGGTSGVCQFVGEYIISAIVDAVIAGTIDHANNGSGYSGYMDQHGKL